MSAFNFDNSYVTLPEEFYSRQLPTPVANPKPLLLNEKLAKSLNLDFSAINSDIFAGNALAEGSNPIAQAYAGHQFGNFNMLGDGRAMLLGEHITTNNERFDIVLKGAGASRYSRNGDGRAAIAPMLREYLISEAMHALNIPTTRSLAVVSTGEYITRETQMEGAILMRVASSHIRVGTFQYAASLQDIDALKALTDYTMQRHYPTCKTPLAFLKAVIKTQVELVTKWQLIGFIHGVMNTDNMSICGETIDYGPCAFMDAYNPATVFSSIDRNGRYAYMNQPVILGWNLARFAETLLVLLDDNIDKAVEIASKEIAKIKPLYEAEWLKGMRKKLGLEGEESQDLALIEAFLNEMLMKQLDYTNTFHDLSALSLEWQADYQARLKRNKRIIKPNNPKIIPRNFYVEEALTEAANGDFTKFNTLLNAVQNPFKENEAFKIPPKQENYKTFCGT